MERSRGHALFSVTTFNGTQISCTRSGLEKISESRYRTTCCHICQQQTSRKMEGTALQEDKNIENQELGNSDIVDLSSNVDHGMAEHETQPGRDDSSSCPSASPVMPETEDRATATDMPETLEKGTSVSVPTCEQAVGTGPQMLDQSTTTEQSTTECRVEATGNEQVDSQGMCM